MENINISFFLVSAGFIAALNLVVFISLRVNYTNNKKAFLAVSSWALVFEALRQLPDYFIGSNTESNALFIASSFFQFAASLTFLIALKLVEGELSRRDRAQIFAYIAFFAFCTLFQLINGLPSNALTWYAVGTPILVVSLAITWKILEISERNSVTRCVLILSSLGLLSARIAIPGIASFDLLFLVYYIEVLLFPVMLLALNLNEVEKTHKKVSQLLTLKIQSEEDIQFILDNSLDITLTTNNVGLLLSWNKRAESLFGYSKSQVLGKVHIDELFFDNYWHKNATGFSDFDSIMENADGATFPVSVRMKTVHKEGDTYSIYVISQPVVEMPSQTPATDLGNLKEQEPSTTTSI